ncbi:MAG: tellurium resistance protein [Paracoccus sp. (in: a-proteobacteria)]|nr:tellurium resistance protein [Paracoccus sp. (in: a-proteobacteria)]
MTRTPPDPAPRLRFAPPKVTPPGLWRRVPPAVFPPVLGLLGLAMAWRAGVAGFGLPGGLSQMLDGVAVALFVFAATAYAVKLARRPAVLHDELQILPGRAGVGAGIVAGYMTAAVLSAYAPGLARVVLVVMLGLHLAMLGVLLSVFRAGPPEIRTVTPAWHLNWVGFIVAARTAPLLGWDGLAQLLLWPMLAMACYIWAVSARQFIAGPPPAPLRPMLAIHLAPLALCSTVAVLVGPFWVGMAGACLIVLVLLILAASARWLTAAGFSPLWGAFTFPIAASAGMLWTLYAAMPSEGLRILAGLVLVAATMIVPPILFGVWRDWARGRLAVKTNAAIA